MKLETAFFRLNAVSLKLCSGGNLQSIGINFDFSATIDSIQNSEYKSLFFFNSINLRRVDRGGRDEAIPIFQVMKKIPSKFVQNRKITLY